MTATARCPMPPDLLEMSRAQLDQVIGKPLCCTACGAELELRCAEGHVHRPRLMPSPNDRSAPAAPAFKKCPDCGNDFEPRPYQRRCDECVKPAARKCPSCGTEIPPRAKLCRVCNPETPKGTLAARSYKPKACSCGRTFVPTGPRAVRCDNCRGAQ